MELHRLLLIFVSGIVISEAAARLDENGLTNSEDSTVCGHGDELKLVVSGVHNATGYPRVQARLEQPAGREPWRLDVALRDASCPHGETRRLMLVTLHGPIEGDYLPTPERLQQLPESRLNEIEIFETSIPMPNISSVSNISWSDTVRPARPNGNQPRDLDLEINEVSPQYEGFIKMPGLGRYKVHQEDATWTRASKICHREGATLALPNSQEEADALWRLKHSATPVRRRSVRGAFGLAMAGMLHRTFLVGARRFTPSANFTTIFGEQLFEAGYDTWAVAPERTEHCVAMFEQVGFFAVSCEIELSFICELPL